MKYCIECGSEQIALQVPEDDNRERRVCQDCGHIQYLNPKIVAGALLSWEGRILLARRAIHPRKGLWTLPAGYMELGESVAEAAARECWEEARARPESMALYGVFSLPHISQVYLMYQGTLAGGEFGVGEESSAAELFAESELPWEQLAFPIVEQTLKSYLDDRELGAFPVFERVIEPKRPPSPMS